MARKHFLSPVLTSVFTPGLKSFSGPRFRPAHVALAGLLLAGCSGPRTPAYPENFSDTNTYSRAYPASNDATCEAARRALLSQGYTIGKAQADAVEGAKNFQDDEQKHQVISFHVVCTSDGHDALTTTVFVNAVQDHYIIKKVSNSAGVGLSVLGSLSMPIGSSDDSLTKIGSETISSPAFYDGFFDLMQRYLPKSAPAAKPAAAAKPPSAATPSPAATPTPAAAPSSASTPASTAAPGASATPGAAATPASSSTAPAPAATSGSSPATPAPGSSPATPAPAAASGSAAAPAPESGPPATPAGASPASAPAPAGASSTQGAPAPADGKAGANP